MFNRKSSYALNKKDVNAIVYIDANENIIRLTREDFDSEEEFQKWKSWSDENYHTEDNRDVVEGKHNMSIDDLSEAALAIPAIDVVMDRQYENPTAQNGFRNGSQIREQADGTRSADFGYFVDGIPLMKIERLRGISHQNISRASVRNEKIKKIFVSSKQVAKTPNKDDR